jgi:HAD superfamily hydrolase (TIGR01484 family)
MRPFAEFPPSLRKRIRFVLTDVDDTLTDGPRLSAATYAALERLEAAGIAVVPVTAAPAGWCDLMARMWPIAAVIGENGGLCFRPEREGGAIERRYWLSPVQRERAHRRLARLGRAIAASISGAVIAHDQRYRETTLAFASPADPERRGAILGAMRDAGLRTTVNSLWVLGWFGDFDKLAMARRMMAELLAADIDRDADAFVYVGDSLNDEPMFGHFPNSVGVASVRDYLGGLATPPRWITEGRGGAGFVEVAKVLLVDR